MRKGALPAWNSGSWMDPGRKWGENSMGNVPCDAFRLLLGLSHNGFIPSAAPPVLGAVQIQNGVISWCCWKASRLTGFSSSFSLPQLVLPIPRARQGLSCWHWGDPVTHTSTGQAQVLTWCNYLCFSKGRGERLIWQIIPVAGALASAEPSLILGLFLPSSKVPLGAPWEVEHLPS